MSSLSFLPPLPPFVKACNYTSGHELFQRAAEREALAFSDNIDQDQTAQNVQSDLGASPSNNATFFSKESLEPQPSIGGDQEIHVYVSCCRYMTEKMLKET